MSERDQNNENEIEKVNDSEVEVEKPRKKTNMRRSVSFVTARRAQQEK